MNKLESLKKITKVVADTCNIDSLKSYDIDGVTTNPSLILEVLKNEKCQSIIDESIKFALRKSIFLEKRIKYAYNKFLIKMGVEILKCISGRISTEIDVNFSYDKEKSIEEAKRIIELYEEENINKDRILIKLAATWQGICAAEKLEKEGINCNLTLVFSLAQALSCAESGVYAVSPFVGRIMDWYKFNTSISNKESLKHPGIEFVENVYNSYKRNGYKTNIIGASIRDINEVIQLAGCDYLTIPINIIKDLRELKGKIYRNLRYVGQIVKKKTSTKENDFYWNHNFNIMASTKLSEGIQKFFFDQEKLKKHIAKKIINFI
ncbi:transaldolase [Candidatus Riesia sp. GBBU]|nr:transaldolase [Candidatus Riesia sp. GBBU]ARC55072.1 transaldolase [Candidatus Riesia sp. GBBU]